MLTSRSPKLDLHGEIVAMVEPLVNQFIIDNYNLNNKYVIIVHGKSTNILTNEVHKTLKKNKQINHFYLNNWNLGETIVEIKLDKNS
jgi:dsDNA-specific endonuclease/ATPase MutS2